MQKLKLRIDALAVESFPVDLAPAARIGTVHGQVDDAEEAAAMTTVQGQPTCLIGVCTCWYSCDGYETCGATNRVTACAVNCPAAGDQPARQPL